MRTKIKQLFAKSAEYADKEVENSLSAPTIFMEVETNESQALRRK